MADYKVIYRNENNGWQAGCPIWFDAVQVARNVESGQCFLQLKVRNIPAKTAGKVKFAASVKSADGETEEVFIECLDADIEPGGSYVVPAKALGLREVTEVEAFAISIEGTDFERSYSPIPVQKALDLGAKARNERVSQAGAKTAEMLRYSHIEHDGWWQCGCGSVNVGSPRCLTCGATLTDLSGWEDEEALAKQADARLYSNAQGMLSSGKKKDAEAALRAFKSLAGYKDSDVFATKAEEKLSEIDTKRAQQSRKAKKIGVVVAAAILILAVAAFALIQHVTAIKYQDAVAKMEAGDYSSAATIFEELGDYGDSNEKLEECFNSLISLEYKNVTCRRSGYNSKNYKYTINFDLDYTIDLPGEVAIYIARTESPTCYLSGSGTYHFSDSAAYSVNDIPHEVSVYGYINGKMKLLKEVSIY